LRLLSEVLLGVAKGDALLARIRKGDGAVSDYPVGFAFSKVIDCKTMRADSSRSDIGVLARCCAGGPRSTLAGRRTM
jgi:hypothetical protein